MNRTAKVVEFVGPAASGKSTAAAHVVATLRREGVICVDRTDVLDRYRSLGAVRRLRRCAPRSLAELRLLARTVAFASAADAMGRDAVVRALRIIALGRVLRGAIGTIGATIALQDQGPIQSVASIALEGRWPDERPVRDVCNSLARNVDLVVHFDLDSMTALERLGARDGARSRFDRWSRERVVERYAAHARQIAALVSALDREGAPVMRLDGAAPFEVNVGSVLARLRDMRYEPTSPDGSSAGLRRSGAM